METAPLSVTPKTLTDHILATLRADTDLSAIKKWFLGEPPQTQYPSSPWGWVEWVGGTQKPGTTNNSIITEDRIYIVVVNKHPNCETAETDVMAYAETVESSLDADRTLDGNVAYSYVADREKQKQFSGDHSIVAVRVTLNTWRKKT
jgi:hypothetical protein